MNYELLKELKDAGFPQRSAAPDDCLEGDFDCEMCGSHFAYNPSLSELIKACGRNFGALIQMPGGDMSFPSFYALQMYGGGLGTQTCKTPEEAVAQLFILYNKTK